MHCGSCGINLEIDFDPDEDMVCAQCKTRMKGDVDCEFFEIIDWDESTNEVIHAVCTIPSSSWPNCNRCQERMEYRDVSTPSAATPTTLLKTRIATLTQGDVDALSGSANRKVRIDMAEDLEVKRLYEMWKEL
jgi:hypothetical protein